MNNKVFRIFVKKRPGFRLAADALKNDLTGFLGACVRSLDLYLRYDVMGISEEGFLRCVPIVLSEPPVDDVYHENLPPLPEDTRLLAYEALPGQFDLRADSCEAGIQMLLGGARPKVRCATVAALGGVSDEDYQKIVSYIINPIECCIAADEKPETLERAYPPPSPVPVMEGFCSLSAGTLDDWSKELGLAMDLDDARFMQAYFRDEEKRDPTLTEVRVLDTYWSDHCRHTTFTTELTDLRIDDERVRAAYKLYLEGIGGKPVTLMSMATAAMKRLRAAGKLPSLDLSDEINACTVHVRVETETGRENWLLLFKNETHNHPTEIEPFGGAATCIGGAIRDPLSGRAYVYQAMRITGAGDPRRPISETLPGKLPQRKLTTAAAAGYSSYGNQIGLATGLVRELYHPGYIAKRMEIGAVVGAASLENVRREEPVPGDVVLLVGGRTGRDGIGGATGSSKSHDAQSVSKCSAEVQKGNAPEERKLQRLFRKKRVARLIKRCNDFGAGGVSVAIGELAPGVSIRLDAIPKKYEGLDGTELAISESQERMAVVCSPSDAILFSREAERENLECTAVARITEEARLRMDWNGETLVDIARSFLDSAGAPKKASIHIEKPSETDPRPWDNPKLSVSERILLLTSDLNFCSQQGLGERFDGSIGAGSVLAPYGGQTGYAPSQVMAALIPAKGSQTASVMSYACDPYIGSPFDSAVFSVVTALAKLAAAGCRMEDAYLTLQEYFPRPGTDPLRWGLPAAAVLGAFWAQMGLEVAAIGGKDSMSGSFEAFDVPPTLCAFAVATVRASRILPSCFTAPGRYLYLMEGRNTPDGLPDLAFLRRLWADTNRYIQEERCTAAYACELGGVPGALSHMSLGGFGAHLKVGAYRDELWHVPWGSIVLETTERLETGVFLGMTQDKPDLTLGSDFIPLTSLHRAWREPLEDVFPVAVPFEADSVPLLEHVTRAVPSVHLLDPHPAAVIPVFPGTNCEYDTAAALEKAGGRADCVLVRNLRPEWLEDSIDTMAAAIRRAQMIIFPGGFSGGDEPDGSGKFIASFFRHPRLAEEVSELLDIRGGLILGICNGFQALCKLGLLPYGEIRELDASCPTLTFNTIGRHQAKYVHTRVSSILSPWLSRCIPGDIHTIPISHGEGRFVASLEVQETLIRTGQIAFQYCDKNGIPGMSPAVNPNGSVLAIEGISSPNGRVLGKMAHSERENGLMGINIPGNKIQPLFEGGVKYFT